MSGCHIDIVNIDMISEVQLLGHWDLVKNSPTYGLLMVSYFRRKSSQLAYQDSSGSSLARDELPRPVLGLRHEVSILPAALSPSLEETKY